MRTVSSLETFRGIGRLKLLELEVPPAEHAGERGDRQRAGQQDPWTTQPGPDGCRRSDKQCRQARCGAVAPAACRTMPTARRWCGQGHLRWFLQDRRQDRLGVGPSLGDLRLRQVPGVAQIDAAKIGVGEARPGEYGVIEPSRRQDLAPLRSALVEARMQEIRAGKIGAAQARIRQDGKAQARAGEIGLGEVGAGEIGVLEPGFAQARAVEPGLVDLRVQKVRTRQVGAIEPRRCQGGETQARRR